MAKLTDILRNGEADRIRDAWNTTEAAGDLKPIPRGKYSANVVEGALTTSRSGTPGYKITFVISDGEHSGRKLWHDVWLTDAAMSIAKRDLAKLGVTSLEQLEQPIPEGIRAEVTVALRRSDEGTEYNEVRRFAVVGIEPPKPEPFAPAEQNGDASTAGEAPF